MREQWRPVLGDPRYLVSDCGRVWSLRTKRILRTKTAGKGYGAVALGRGNDRYVHRLVLDAFVGPCPIGHETRHQNNDRRDNRLANLAWGTHLQNIRDKVAHDTDPRGERNANAKLTEQQALAIIADPRPYKAIAEAFGISFNQVERIKNGRRWRHLRRAA